MVCNKTPNSYDNPCCVCCLQRSGVAQTVDALLVVDAGLKTYVHEMDQVPCIHSLYSCTIIEYW